MAMKLQFPIKLQGYAIYNPNTGLYSKGGVGPKWKKTPKIWSGLGPLKNHLNQFYYQDYVRPVVKIIVLSVYDGCIIIDVTTGESVGWSPHEFILQKAKARQEELRTNKFSPYETEIVIR